MTRISQEKLCIIRSLAAEGCSAAEIASRLHVQRDTVTRAAKDTGVALTRPRSDGAAATAASLRHLAAQGLTATEIARETGLSPGAVRRIASRHDVSIRRMTREERAAACGNAVMRQGKVIGVPGWVSPDLRSEYRDIAADHGAAYADRAVRKLMEAAREH